MPRPNDRGALRLPQRGLDALKAHRQRQAIERTHAGANWHEHGLVFCSRVGTELDAANVRRSFRAVCLTAGLDPEEWTLVS